MKKAFGILVLVGVVLVGYWLISPLFIDEEVDEALPTVEDAAVTQERKEMPEKMAVVKKLGQQVPEERKEAFEKEMMEEMPAVEMDEPKPQGPQTIASGSFVDVAHHGSGNAKLVDLGESKILRLENLDVLNGPDLRVLLSKSPTVASHDDLGEYIEVGKLKGNKGNQNYAIAAGVDLSEYRTAVIYCKPFQVVFNSALLN